MEIRPIRRDEAEEFLHVLCQSFDLDVATARDVFYNEPFFDLGAKWALLDQGAIVSILTLTPLQFGWGWAVGVAGVATVPELRGRGHASRLIRHVLAAVDQPALLFARAPKIYERVGFSTLDIVCRGMVLGAASDEEPGEMLDSAVFEPIYAEWAAMDPCRLVRDDRRWQLWRWHFRIATEIPGGYLCFEPGGIREAMGNSVAGVLAGVEWYGLEKVTRSLGITLSDPKVELTLMGYRFPDPPQMFMTDQF